MIIKDEVVVTEITRRQLYDEVWSISVKGVSEKYGIPYSQLSQQLKIANIPTPSAGYWTKLEFGKPVEKPKLVGNETEFIKLNKKETQIISLPQEKTSKSVVTVTAKSEQPLNIERKEKTQSKEVKHTVTIEPCASLNDEAKTETQFSQIYNIYDRKTLYNEVWSAPITRVAQKYKVSDVAILKVCKSMNIPTPPAGFWAKVRAGKEVKIISLPDADNTYTKMGLRNCAKSNETNNDKLLDFLDEDERHKIIEAALNAEISGPNTRLSPVIRSHRDKFISWQKAVRYNERAFFARDRVDPGEKPLWVDEVSAETRPRIYKIIDAIGKAIEPLDGKINSDLSFTVYGEQVIIKFSESKDKKEHIPTKEENIALLKYEEERKRYSWASKPKINKHDYFYNGRLRMDISCHTFVRDSNTNKIEDFLGKIIIKLYEAANEIKQARLVAEEAERKRQEIETRKRIFLELYNQEVDRTNALVNAAQDFDTAQKIREYVKAVSANLVQSAESEEWITWANAKANWFDPTVASKDSFFGVRQHGKTAKDKELEKEYSTYRIKLDFEDN